MHLYQRQCVCRINLTTLGMCQEQQDIEELTGAHYLVLITITILLGGVTPVLGVLALKQGLAVGEMDEMFGLRLYVLTKLSYHRDDCFLGFFFKWTAANISFLGSQRFSLEMSWLRQVSQVRLNVAPQRRAHHGEDHNHLLQRITWWQPLKSSGLHPRCDLIIYRQFFPVAMEVGLDSSHFPNAKEIQNIHPAPGKNLVYKPAWSVDILTIWWLCAGHKEGFQSRLCPKYSVGGSRAEGFFHSERWRHTTDKHSVTIDAHMLLPPTREALAAEPRSADQIWILTFWGAWRWAFQLDHLPTMGQINVYTDWFSVFGKWKNKLPSKTKD